MKYHLIILAAACSISFMASAQPNAQDRQLSPKVSDKCNSPLFCSARLINDTLILENSQISRTFLWYKGNLITRNLADKHTGKIWTSGSLKPCKIFPGQQATTSDAGFSHSRYTCQTRAPGSHN